MTTGTLSGLLRIRLAAAACGLLAAGAATMVPAAATLARGYLAGQDGRQLRAYARLLTSHPFTARPGGVSVNAAPGPGFLTEVTSPGGRLVLRVGPDTPPGPALARLPRRARRPSTVPAGRGGRSWLVITAPVRFQARRIPFTYGSGGFALLVTGPDRPGTPGRLVAGLNLAPVSQVVRRLVLTLAAVSAALVLAVAAAALTLLRMLIGRAAAASAGRAAAAQRSAERLSRQIAETCAALQRPLRVIGGAAEYYRQRRPLPAAEASRLMRRIAAETARLGAVLDAQPPPVRDRAPPGPEQARRR